MDITFIVGKDRSGKSFLSRKLSLLYKNPITISCRRYKTKERFFFRNVTDSTDLIIFEDVIKKEIIKELLINDELIIESPGEKRWFLSDVKILVVCDESISNDVLKMESEHRIHCEINEKGKFLNTNFFATKNDQF